MATTLCLSAPLMTTTSHFWLPFLWVFGGARCHEMGRSEGVWKDSYKTMYIFWRLTIIFFIPHHTSLPKYHIYIKYIHSIISYTSYFDSQPHRLFDLKKTKKQLKVAVFADDWVQTQVQPTSAIAQRIVENTSPLSTQSNLYVSQSIRGK